VGSHKQTPEAWLLGKAIALAATAHGAQTDRAGEPYILHPLRVMLACTTPETRLAAVLHDVVEDTDTDVAGLAADFPPPIVEAVDALSRRDGEDYFAFIERARANPIARAVKLADLHDNYLNPSRLASLRPALRERYEKAHAMLSAELARCSDQPAPQNPPPSPTGDT
jgi:guanosine-3',5'-bis(diphosphate) 3'-pyrophosphohydrolase